jgi:hypothetical protein
MASTAIPRDGVHLFRAMASTCPERVEAACQRALAIGTRSFSSVKSILDTKLDRKRPEKAAEGPAIVHDNIRGPTFYH